MRNGAVHHIGWWTERTLATSALLIVLAGCDPYPTFRIENPCNRPLRAAVFVEVDLRDEASLRELQLFRIPANGFRLRADDQSPRGDTAELIVESVNGERQIVQVDASEELNDDLIVTIPESYCD
jgi:hypothetical protein